MPFVTSGIFTLMIRQIELVDLTNEKTVRCRGKVWHIIRQNFVTFLGKEIGKIDKINLIEN